MVATCTAREVARRWIPARLTLGRKGALAGFLGLSILAGNGLLCAEEQPKNPERIEIDPKPKSIVFAVAFSKDGRQIALTCEDKTVAIHDANTGKFVARLEGHTERVWTAAFSPDGATVSSCSGEYARPEDGGAIKIWDLKTGKEKASLSGHRGLVFHVTYSPDGKTLLSAGWDGTVKLWDVAAGKEKATLTEHTGPVRSIVYTPDGKSFATASFDGTVRFWDAATAKHQRKLEAHSQGVQCVAFSPCGRYLATVPRPTGQAGGDEISLWDLTSNREPARIAGHRGHVLSVDFSPDGKTLASCGGWFSQYGEVKLFETASGKERGKVEIHKEWVECVKFSPNGQVLVSVGGFTHGVPGQVHVQPMIELLEKKPSAATDVTAEQLQALWDDLADPDAAKAYQVVLTLATSARLTVPFLKPRLKPVAAADPEKLAQVPKLIANLNHDNFKERERARKELEALGEMAAPALRKALAQESGVEVLRRLRQLLQRVELPITAPELLRTIRAIEVLERLGTPAARELLQVLGHGVPEARPTWEAKESLKRLAK